MKKSTCICLGIIAGLGLWGASANEPVMAKGTTKLTVSIPNNSKAQATPNADDDIKLNSNGDGTITFSGKTNPNAKVTIERQSDFKDYKVKADANGNYSKTITLSKKAKKSEYSISSKVSGKDDSAESDFLVINKGYGSSSTASSSSSSQEASSSSTTNYQQVSYDDLARHSKKMNGKDVSITGSIIQVEHEDGMYMLLVAMNGDPDQTVMVAVAKSDKPNNGDMVKNDLVTIQGTAGGKQKYTTVMGDDNDVPYIDCNEVIQDQGKAPDDYGA